MEGERMMKTARQTVGAVVCVGLLAGVTGCDWWPPTLQERIGQQEAQTKALLGEKARMQAKITELTKALEDLKAQAAQMEQTNNSLKTQMEQLKVSLAQAEAKAAKMATTPPKKRK
jgi:peptidoglycan hydrolase CwlO-like protein